MNKIPCNRHRFSLILKCGIARKFAFSYSIYNLVDKESCDNFAHFLLQMGFSSNACSLKSGLGIQNRFVLGNFKSCYVCKWGTKGRPFLGNPLFFGLPFLSVHEFSELLVFLIVNLTNFRCEAKVASKMSSEIRIRSALRVRIGELLFSKA